MTLNELKEDYRIAREVLAETDHEGEEYDYLCTTAWNIGKRVDAIEAALAELDLDNELMARMKLPLWADGVK